MGTCSVATPGCQSMKGDNCVLPVSSDKIMFMTTLLQESSECYHGCFSNLLGMGQKPKESHSAAIVFQEAFFQFPMFVLFVFLILTEAANKQPRPKSQGKLYRAHPRNPVNPMIWGQLIPPK